MYKLVILDYDGTMVGKSGVVTDVVKQAILKTVKKGIKVSISTGRWANSLLPIIRELRLDVPHVFLGGALVYNPLYNLILLEDPVEYSAVLEVCEFANKNNLYLEASTRDNLYYNKRVKSYLQRRQRLNDGLLTQTDICQLAEHENILCLRFFLDTERKKDKFQIFKKNLSDKLNFPIGYAFDQPNLEVVTVTDIAVSKVSALRHLCQYLNIKPHEVMAIGDSPIDLPLIENVGLGIAMGNAKKEVQKKAKWIAPDVEDNGVAAALVKFVLSP